MKSVHWRRAGVGAGDSIDPDNKKYPSDLTNSLKSLANEGRPHPCTASGWVVYDGSCTTMSFWVD